MKMKFIKFGMATAFAAAEMTTAKRLKVGAVITTADTPIAIGYNGTPSGWSNDCEKDGKTIPEVLHAEANAIAKLAKSTNSGDGAYMFITHAPCLHCAKLIYQAGIKVVHYSNEYYDKDGKIDTKGLVFLKKCKILVNPRAEDYNEYVKGQNNVK